MYPHDAKYRLHFFRYEMTTSGSAYTWSYPNAAIELANSRFRYLYEKEYVNAKYKALCTYRLYDNLSAFRKSSYRDSKKNSISKPGIATSHSSLRRTWNFRCRTIPFPIYPVDSDDAGPSHSIGG